MKHFFRAIDKQAKIMKVDEFEVFVDKGLFVKYNPFDNRGFPNYPLVYFIIDVVNDELLYIGKTTVPNQRIRYHNHKGKEREFYIRAVDDDIEVNGLENIYIYQLIVLD